MLPLTYTNYWRVAGVLLLFAVLAGAVMPAIWIWPPHVARDVWFGGADKWTHAISFAFLAVWFSGQYRTGSYWRIALGLLAFGLLIELVQRSLSHRTAEWYDVLADVVGIGIGLLVALAGLGGWSQRFEQWLESRRGK